MKALSPIDWAILERLAEGPQAVGELHDAGPRATLYRRVAALRAEGLIAKASRGGYALTAPGERMLAERHATVFTEGLITAYPPLREVPTPQYRALLELAFAARALRQHTDQDDRHAAFLILGPTLRWKTSAAEFLAVALGVDPAHHITDLRTESGQSLWIRRGAKGQIVTERQLIEAPLAVFDEYQAGDRAVRRAVAPFLAGRRRLAIENTVASLGPVAVVILNPGAGSTLSARTGLSEPQLRRLIPLDVTNLAMPDLALVGMRAVAAARLAGALQIPAPRASCEDPREPLIELLRAVLTPEGLALIDVDMMLGLGRGMTAWFPATVALRQAVYNALLVVDTVGWVKPGWVDAVRVFPHGNPCRPAAPPVVASAEPKESKRDQHRISLFPERREAAAEDPSMTTHQSMLPTFSLSDDTKAGLIWLSRELGIPLDDAVAALLDHYRMMVGSPDQFSDLQTILSLRDACGEADIAVSDLRECVELKADLRECELSLPEVREAVEVGKALDAAGLTLEQAGHVVEVIAALDKAGIDAKVADNLSAAVKRFDALGYDAQRMTTLADLSSRLEALGVRPAQLAEHLGQLSTCGRSDSTPRRRPPWPERSTRPGSQKRIVA